MYISEEKVSSIIVIASAEKQAHDNFYHKYYPDREMWAGDSRYEDTPEKIELQRNHKLLVDALNNCSYDEILDIETLMAFGRGDSDSFESLRDSFAWNYPSPEGKEDAITYLAGKPLATYLLKGLAKL
jgi:hypothetical protein